MLALQKTRPAAGLELRDVPLPTAPAPHEVLIEVVATGICGSDLHVEEWTPMYQSFMANALPVTIGHETAGCVIARGSAVTSVKIGDRVVINPAVPCGICPSCTEAKFDDCRNRQAVGMVCNGAFARLVLAPADFTYVIPDNVPIELGALAEPLTTSAHALATAGMSAGKRVIVFGPGPIGQGAAILARQLGASDVVVVGMNDQARFATLGALGFDRVVDMAHVDAKTTLAELAGDGFDIAIEAAGVPAVVDQALAVLAPWGILALAGMPEKPATFDVLRLVRNRLQIRGVSRTPKSAWMAVLDAMAKCPTAFAPMITHRLPLKDALYGFELCHTREASKVLLYPS
jgi:threonine 3-dehydrogenase